MVEQNELIVRKEEEAEEEEEEKIMKVKRKKINYKVDLKRMDEQLERHFDKAWLSQEINKEVKDCEIDCTKLVIKNFIATGAFGSVYKAVYDGQHVAGTYTHTHNYLIQFNFLILFSFCMEDLFGKMSMQIIIFMFIIIFCIIIRVL